VAAAIKRRHPVIEKKSYLASIFPEIAKF